MLYVLIHSVRIAGNGGNGGDGSSANGVYGAAGHIYVNSDYFSQSGGSSSTTNGMLCKLKVG